MEGFLGTTNMSNNEIMQFFITDIAKFHQLVKKNKISLLWPIFFLLLLENDVVHKAIAAIFWQHPAFFSIKF